MAVKLLNDILKEFLFKGSKPETRFISGFLEQTQPPGETDEPEEKPSGWLAAVTKLLRLYQEQPEDGDDDVQKEPEIDREAFDKVYASIKGLYLFWLDFAVFNMLRHTNRPNAFRDEMDKYIRLYNDKHRSRRKLMAGVVGQYKHYAAYYLENASPTGELDPGAGLETSAFLDAMTLAGVVRACSRVSREEIRAYFADRHEYILMWLRPLESRIKGGTAITKKRR
jgi:hypothetical protein